jgi:DNA-binding response OmpR family regulator
MANSMVSPGVLIVEDDDDLREVIAFDFERIGFRTFKAGDATHALEIIRTETINLVLTDVRLPGDSGIELLNRIRERDPAVPPVIIMTGYTELDLTDAKKWGAEAVFGKPLDRKALLSMSKNIVKM